ncbi:MAG TPA: hypothetical protein VF812_01480 [Ktedonobacterales bacterium]
MPIIAAPQADRLRTYFEEQARDPVTILLFIHPAQAGENDDELALASQDAQELLEEVVALAPAYLILEMRDPIRDAAEAQALGIERTPAIVLRGKAAGQVRTFGVPLHYEFTTLIEDLRALLAGGQTTLDDSTREALVSLRRPAHLQVFVAPT